MNTNRLNLAHDTLAKVAAVALLIAALIAVPVLAGPGHDHDHDAPKAAGTASPRLHASTELFEITGIYESGGLTLYLDHYATNEPIKNASIEFESGKIDGVASVQTDGTYRIDFAELKVATGDVPFSFFVKHGDDSDLLTADLALHSHAAKKDDHFHLTARHIVIGAIALMGLISSAWIIRRKMKGAKR
jgi:hypothetical protein